MEMRDYRKGFDVITFGLLLIGGLNWGLVSLFGYDPVATFFGPMTILTRVAYGFIGLSALYELSHMKALFDRWRPIAAH
jgi:uncharacterized membrane protein YuzA (DUF378 family)